MRSWKWSIATVAIVALSGCAPVSYRAKVADLSAACSGSWSQLRPSHLPIDQPESPSEEFAEHSMCLGPPALLARTSVMLYDLGAVPRPGQVVVRLPISAGGTLAGMVDVLDADFHPLKHRGFGEFTRRGEAYTLVVFLHDGSPRYLAVSPDAAFVGHQVNTIGSAGGVMPIATPYAMFMVAKGQEVNRAIPLMAGGKVSVMMASSPQPGQIAAP